MFLSTMCTGRSELRELVQHLDVPVRSGNDLLTLSLMSIIPPETRARVAKCPTCSHVIKPTSPSIPYLANLNINGLAVELGYDVTRESLLTAILFHTSKLQSLRLFVHVKEGGLHGTPESRLTTFQDIIRAARNRGGLTTANPWPDFTELTIYAWVRGRNSTSAYPLYDHYSIMSLPSIQKVVLTGQRRDGYWLTHPINPPTTHLPLPNLHTLNIDMGAFSLINLRALLEQLTELQHLSLRRHQTKHSHGWIKGSDTGPHGEYLLHTLHKRHDTLKTLDLELQLKTALTPFLFGPSKRIEDMSEFAKIEHLSITLQAIVGTTFRTRAIAAVDLRRYFPPMMTSLKIIQWPKPFTALGRHTSTAKAAIIAKEGLVQFFKKLVDEVILVDDCKLKKVVFVSALSSHFTQEQRPGSAGSLENVALSSEA
ncbi:hypothetical protein B0T17DRAFT_7253 [Bombardia bombarda]|uniref:Uncharacterized protein n=1 Tax=Bombardia bombarda TaxID=252184 RepID=A0AA40CDQ8_9PEZI|nr:hypothetical protein B0T17DRAFT_7253 [Bombardia bombarda]